MNLKSAVIAVHENLRRVFDLKINRTLLRKVNEAVLLMELFDGVPLETSLPPLAAGAVMRSSSIPPVASSAAQARLCALRSQAQHILINNAGQVKVIDLGQGLPNGTANPSRARRITSPPNR